MPDSESTPDMIADAHLHALVLQFYPDIADIVRYICLRYQHIPTRDEVEEFRGQIVLLLYTNDCHRLKTFDPARGAFKTWLTKVIEHHIPTQLKRQQAWDGLDVILPGKLLTEGTQELNMMQQEQRTAITAEIEKLSAGQRQLIRLICNDLPVAEIAKQMKIKPESVHRMKHQVIQKIKAGLKKEGGANSVPNHPKRKMKIIQNNESRFFTFRAIYIKK